jgi:hypothetical protein
MQANENGRQVKEVVRVAVGRVAPGELSRFDEVWQAYLDDLRDSRQILKSRELALGAGRSASSQSALYGGTSLPAPGRCPGGL